MKIMIDLNSIKLNPNAGRTYIEILGRATYTYFVEWVQEIQRIYSMTPDPKYLFKYLPANVVCNTCGKLFNYSELYSDCYNNGMFSDTICPYCYSRNCCSIEFEKIEEALIRKKNL